MTTPDLAGPPQPATCPFPPGTPAVVPADFAAARDQAYETQLTPEEIAEFRALRADKKARDEAAAAAAAEAAAKLSPPTHHVHLANCDIIDGSTIETHYATGDGDLIPVAGAYLMASAA